jgi:DNA-binding response OmpR family regulator
MRILVGDDEELLLEILVESITIWGHQVTKAASFYEVYEAVSTKEFDLALVDWGMVKSRGVKTIHEIRPELRVVVISGIHTPELLLDSKTSWLEKPFKMNTLRTVIESSNR